MEPIKISVFFVRDKREERKLFISVTSEVTMYALECFIEQVELVRDEIFEKSGPLPGQITIEPTICCVARHDDNEAEYAPGFNIGWRPDYDKLDEGKKARFEAAFDAYMREGEE